MVDIKERVGSWRSSIKFNQITEEEFEQDHELKMYAHLRNKLIKQFDDVSVKVSDWYSALNNQIPNYHTLYKILYFNLRIVITS